MSIDKAILERLKEIAKTRESVEKQIELLNSLKGRDWRELVQMSL
jgi:hypothetical protein